MDTRQLKALEIAARVRLVWEGKVCTVPSQSGSGESYKVERTLYGYTCTCEDYELRRQDCKHVIAARLVWEREHGEKAPEIDTDAAPKKKTYKQDWPAYNEAQTTEKHRLRELLADLVRAIPTDPRPCKRGRPQVLLADVLFAAVFKVYSTVSSRRFACDLKDAHEKGYVSRPLHYNSINAYLEDESLTPVLKSLIIRSSLPLRAVETTFAPDSSGFTTSRFVKWFDHKYGVTRQEHDWVKAHIMTGVKTNIVTAVEIHDRNAGDAPQMKPMLATTAENFTVKEVPADKGYLSHDNLEAVMLLGGTAYIPFKINSVPGEPGTLWEKMFHFYALHRDEFLPKYHQRSNVESTFSMVKAKFGDAVRSKTDVAMVNEVLCKFLCHNICVCIQSHCELGIEPVFWENEPAERPDILPLIRRA